MSAKKGENIKSISYPLKVGKNFDEAGPRVRIMGTRWLAALTMFSHVVTLILGQCTDSSDVNVTTGESQFSLCSSKSKRLTQGRSVGNGLQTGSVALICAQIVHSQVVWDVQARGC